MFVRHGNWLRYPYNLDRYAANVSVLSGSTDSAGHLSCIMMDSAARQVSFESNVSSASPRLDPSSQWLSLEIPASSFRVWCLEKANMQRPPANQRSYLDITIDPQQGYALSNLPAPFSDSELRDRVVYCTNVEFGQGF